MNLKEENIQTARQIFLDVVDPLVAEEPENEVFLRGRAGTFGTICSTYAGAFLLLGLFRPDGDAYRAAAEANIDAFAGALSEHRSRLAAEPENKLLGDTIRFFETIQPVLPEILATLGGFEPKA